MIGFVIVFGAAIMLAMALTTVSFFAAHHVARRAAAIDRDLRPREAVSGRCEACGGAGTRLEPHTAPGSTEMRRATCFRCGGTGLPPPIGEMAVLPGTTPLGLSVRELSSFVRAWPARRRPGSNR